MANEFFHHGNGLVARTLARSEQVNSVFRSVEAGFDKLPSEQDLKFGLVSVATDTSPVGAAANQYSAHLPYPPAIYAEGMLVVFRPARPNTGPATINVDGLGVVPIQRVDGSSLEANDLSVGALVDLRFDGAAFRMTGAAVGMVVSANAAAAAAADSALSANNALNATLLSAAGASSARDSALSAAGAAALSAQQAANSAASAVTLYTWIAYANSADGTVDFTTGSPGGRTYIGIATNKTTQTPSEEPGDYAWAALGGGGGGGEDGLSIVELTIWRRAASAPATPNGGSYNFGTKTLTPPSGWSSAIPAGTDPVYTSRAVASIQGTSGIATPSAWSPPVLAIQNGEAGAPALSLEVSRKAVSVWAYANGGVVSWADANGTLKVRAGNSDVTAGATLSASASAGVTGTINTAANTPVSGQPKGYYRVTDMTGTTGTLTLVAVYNGVTLTETFSISKTTGGYEIVGSLPGSDLFEGRVVFLTTDDKLYRYTGAAWTTSVPATDISGQLADAQIAAMVASKITGQLSDSQLAAIAAAKVTGQIAGTQIADGEISTPKLAAGAITTAKLAAGAVTANEVAANAVTAVKIAAGAVEAAKIAAGAIEAGKIASGAVTADKIGANAITAGKIASGAVETDKLSAGAVTATKLAATQASLMFATIGTFQTASSGQRVVIADAYFKAIASTGVVAVHLGDLDA